MLYTEMSTTRLCPHVYCGKTADWIQVPFGVLSGVGRGLVYKMGVVIVEGEVAVLDGEFGASHCNQWDLCDVLF